MIDDTGVQELRDAIQAIALRDVELSRHLWTVVSHMIRVGGGDPEAMPAIPQTSQAAQDLPENERDNPDLQQERDVQPGGTAEPMDEKNKGWPFQSFDSTQDERARHASEQEPVDDAKTDEKSDEKKKAPSKKKAQEEDYAN